MATVAEARIGPNAISQVAHAVEARHGRAAAALLMAAVGYSLDALPDTMVDELEARELALAVLDAFGTEEGLATLADAGRRTGDYLLAHRIPRLAQYLIRSLPPRLGLRLLLAAVARHAWTFAGSGRFVVHPGTPWPVLEIVNCPACRGLTAEQPICAFHAATFARLVEVLVAPTLMVTEVACGAMGAVGCRFEMTMHSEPGRVD